MLIWLRFTLQQFKVVCHPGNYLPSLMAWPLFFTFAAVFFLGVYVLLRERHSAVKTAFFFMTLPASIWLFSFGFMYLAVNETAALFWAKAAYLGVPFIPSTIYYFTVKILRLGEKRRGRVLLFFLTSVFFSIVIIGTDRVIDGVARFSWGYYPHYTLFSFYYLTFFYGLMVATVRHYVVELGRSQSDNQRARIKGLLAGFCIVSVASVDYLAKFGVPVYPFGYGCILLFIGIAAFVITRYRLVDITPSLAAEEIICAMGDALIVLDAEDLVRVVNDAAVRLFEIDPEEIVGEHLSAVSAYFPVKNTPASVHRVGTNHAYEIEHKRSDGRPVMLHVSESCMTDGLGCVMATVLIVRDVTLLRQAELAVKETESRFSRLYEDASEAILVLDEFGRFASANPAAERLLGARAGELTGRIFVMSHFLPPDQVGKVLKLLRSIMQGASEPRFELRLKREDDQTLLLEAQASAVKQNGKISAVQLMLWPVGHLANFEEALERTRLEMQASVRRQLLEMFKGHEEWVSQIDKLKF